MNSLYSYLQALTKEMTLGNGIEVGKRSVLTLEVIASLNEYVKSLKYAVISIIKP